MVRRGVADGFCVIHLLHPVTACVSQGVRAAAAAAGMHSIAFTFASNACVHAAASVRVGAERGAAVRAGAWPGYT